MHAVHLRHVSIYSDWWILLPTCQRGQGLSFTSLWPCQTGGRRWQLLIRSSGKLSAQLHGFCSDRQTILSVNTRGDVPDNSDSRCDVRLTHTHTRRHTLPVTLYLWKCWVTARELTLAAPVWFSGVAAVVIADHSLRPVTLLLKRNACHAPTHPHTVSPPCESLCCCSFNFAWSYNDTKKKRRRTFRHHSLQKTYGLRLVILSLKQVLKMNACVKVNNRIIRK